MKRCAVCGCALGGGFCNQCGKPAAYERQTFGEWFGALTDRSKTVFGVSVLVVVVIVASALGSLKPPDTTSCHYHYDHSYQWKGEPGYDMGEDAYCDGFSGPIYK